MKEIVLSNKPAVAQGSIRDVYRHPNPHLLVKVVRLSTLDEKYGSGRRWFKSRKRRYGHLIGYLREVREQLALQAAAKEHPRYLRKIVGFAETDLGPGLVVEAVFAPNGSYAPTLGTLLKDGPLSPKLEGAFDRFCEEVVRSPLILSEMNIDNVVFGSTGDGDQRFVLIDGIGHKKFIPLEVASRALNRWNSRRKIRNLRRRVASSCSLRGGGNARGDLHGGGSALTEQAAF
jgi:hypothetical protein